MSKQTKIGLILGIIVFMILMVWLFSAGEEKKNPTSDLRKPFVSDNWRLKFQVDDKNPMGLYLFTSLAKAHLNTGCNLIEIQDEYYFDTLVNVTKDTSTYVFVGNNFGLENKEIDSLLVRVQEGSDLFISFNDFTENLYERLLEGIEFQFDYAEEVNVFTNSHKYKMINLFQTDTVACDWRAFGQIDDGISYVSLSSFMEFSNFIKVKVGAGAIFLHTTPTMFYNYQIKRRDGFKYTEYVLNELSADRNIYFLELGRLSDDYGNYDVDDEDGPGLKQDDSYLKLIFQNPTLLIALMLSILGIILFVIFRSKRTQPVVPYLQTKKDMTMAFAETITSIYFAKRHPYGLLQVQRKNFYATVQKHFFVDLQRRDGDRALTVLAEKSNLRVEDIKDLVARLETKEAFGVSDPYIADMQKRLHDFYKLTGIISADLSEKMHLREMVFKRSLLLPLLFILGGIDVIILGLYYLVSAIGIGIALWPIGIVLLFFGIKRITNPYLRITGEEIIYYSSLGRKKVYNRADLISTDVRQGGAIFNFRNEQKLIINYWDMSRFDKKQFKQFLSKLNKLDL